jgi:hypothetical protein
MRRLQLLYSIRQRLNRREHHPEHIDYGNGVPIADAQVFLNVLRHRANVSVW